MRHKVCFVLLVPILALAGGPVRFTTGTVDTVGGTTYDWQFSGPVWRTLVNSAGRGIYASWMYSASMSGSTFPDRNMRINYYDCTSHEWSYIDSTDFLYSGTSVFPKRSGYGSIDTDTSGGLFISCHATLGGETKPWVAKGSSNDLSDSTDVPACMWPPVAVGRNGAVHILAMTNSMDLTYCRIAPDSWPHWSTPLTQIWPSPGFPSHDIAASKVSDRVSLVWEVNQYHEACQMHSTDGGVTWGNPAALTPPDAFGGDTGTGFHFASLFPFYDRHDRFHVVATLVPLLGDTAWEVPSQIWHYCPDNTPEWSRIHVAGCDPAHMRGTLGSNATYACRPSIGEDRAGGLYTVWEQFDSLNFDSTTSRLRADIFLAQDNGDNGLSWQPGVRITDQGTWSCRFPSAVDYFTDDNFRVAYIIDQQAGFFGGFPPEGDPTVNPVVVHSVPVTVGIAEDRGQAVPIVELSAAPNPSGRATTISYRLARAGSVTLAVHDVTGKAVRRLAGGLQPTGPHSAFWDGRDDRGRLLAAGVYLVRLESDGGKKASGVAKIVLTE
jgi:hypothetical protein